LWLKGNYPYFHKGEVIMATIEKIIEDLEADIERSRAEVERILDLATAQHRSNLTEAEDSRAEFLMDKAEKAKASLKRAQAVKDEQDEQEKRLLETHKVPSARSVAKYDEVIRVGDTTEPHVYSRDKDPEGKGQAFLMDVAAAYRGSPEANERLARHMKEHRVDNPRFEQRAAGDFTSTNATPAIVVPGYLLSAYAHKPAVARPFADSINHRDLPPTGLTVEIGRETTAITAAIQSAELTAVTGTNVAVTKGSLPVETATAWTNLSRQSIDRGVMTEDIVMSSMLDAMHGALETEIITKATTGLWEGSTQLAYTDASPTPALMHPYLLQAASKVSAALLNRGRPNSVLMAPRRWFWYQSVVDSKWPVVGQQGVDAQAIAMSTNAGYDKGNQGRLPSGLDIFLSAAVPLVGTAAGAQTAGDEDAVFTRRPVVRCSSAPSRRTRLVSAFFWSCIPTSLSTSCATARRPFSVCRVLAPRRRLASKSIPRQRGD
jgi:hypothetical protein